MGRVRFGPTKIATSVHRAHLLAEPAVELFFLLALLDEAGGHHHVPAGEAGQHLEGRRRAGGIGVERVVDHGHAARALEQLQAGARRAARGETPRAISSIVIPSFFATWQDSTMFWMLCLPRSFVSHRTRPPSPSDSVKRLPEGPTLMSSAYMER